MLAPRHQALVGRDVREASLASMTGHPHDDDQAEQDQETRSLESAAAEGVSSGLNQPETEESLAKENKALVAAVVMRRKLYRQLSGTEVPWFPHDNDMNLLKELCWESGRPRLGHSRDARGGRRRSGLLGGWLQRRAALL